MPIEPEKLRRLLDTGRSLVTQLDPEVVLRHILEEARDLTDAQYVALGVLNEQRTELERFLTLGIDEQQRAAIGDLPRGRGVLGVLIEDPRPLRLAHVGDHPHSYGFPPGHPVMESFLGVPIVIRGEAWGNLYCADKHDAGEFTEEDEEAASILADLAATALANALVYRQSEERRLALEQAVQALEAARDIADAIGGAGELQHILELVVKRGRALVQARSLLILLLDGDELVVESSAGHVVRAHGRRVPVVGSTSGEVLGRMRPERIEDVAARLRISAGQLGVPGAQTGLLVPIVYKGEPLGLLAAFDRGVEAKPFTEADERLLRTFAASAGHAVAISRSVEADRLRSTITAADAERARWARELHDQTLQSLAGLRVGLSTALRSDDLGRYRDATRLAIEDVETEIANLRSIIADLRPSLLDDLGLRAALESLLQRRRDDGLVIESAIELPDSFDSSFAERRDLETAVYRVLQESLTNVVKHAHATRVQVSVTIDDTSLVLQVSDNGRGFNPEDATSGFGLAGMRERAFLLGGSVTIDSAGAGTTVRAGLPFQSGSDLGTDQVVA